MFDDAGLHNGGGSKTTGRVGGELSRAWVRDVGKLYIGKAD